MNRTVTTGHRYETDDEFVHAAFSDWKQEHGFGDLIGLGDIGARSLSQVMQRAQALKMRAKEKKSA
jgi:hypothetical protein